MKMIFKKNKKFAVSGGMIKWHTASNVVWQTVAERQTGSSERSVANSPMMSVWHVEL